MKTLERGLKILEMIYGSPEGLLLNELASRCELAPSTTLRFLRYFEERQLLSRDPASKRFLPAGLGFRERRGRAFQKGLRVLARPHMMNLVKSCRETCHLSVLHGDDALNIETVEGSSPVRVCFTIEGRLPLHATSTGKVLLAFLPAAEAQRIIQKNDLRRLTPRTITTASGIARQLRRVRRLGYAYDNQEYEFGVRCVAAPVRNRGGDVVAALGVSGVIWRIPERRVPKLAAQVVAAAEAISQELGHWTYAVMASRGPSARHST